MNLVSVAMTVLELGRDMGLLKCSYNNKNCAKTLAVVLRSVLKLPIIFVVGNLPVSK